MRGRVLKGQLTYIDTDKGQIQILDRADDKATTLNVDTQTVLPGSSSWERLLGEDVEAVVIDGKTKNVWLIEEA